MIVKGFSFFFLALAYCGLFLHQENIFQDTPPTLSFLPSGKIQRVALGYLKQLGGEILFIKSNVFLGGVKPGRNPYDYADPLTKHLKGATELHPDFSDTYFLCNASLPYIGPEYALKANKILEKGMETMPDNILWPFFIGFNYFYHLNEPIEAAKYLKIASEKPEAPKWLAHLASSLLAKGGNIKTGIIWLRGMVATEEDDGQRKRYQESLEVFEQAYVVEQAIERFNSRHGNPPGTLQDLVPEFVAEIPQFEGYELSYTPPSLKLLRPHIERQLRKLRETTPGSIESLKKKLSDLFYIEHLSQPTDYRTARLFPAKPGQ